MVNGVTGVADTGSSPDPQGRRPSRLTGVQQNGCLLQQMGVLHLLMMMMELSLDSQSDYTANDPRQRRAAGGRGGQMGVGGQVHKESQQQERNRGAQMHTAVNSHTD